MDEFSGHLDELLDVGDASDMINVPCPSCVYDDDYVEGFTCANHRPRPQSYLADIEKEKEKLAKENEATLLEALRSMDNYGGVLSDLVSLSSTLNQPPINSSLQSAPLANVDITTAPDDSFPSSFTDGSMLFQPVEETASLVDAPNDVTVSDGSAKSTSMLKQLLLNPNNYPKEVDAGNITVDYVAEQIVPKTFSSEETADELKHKKKSKKQKKVAKKPFTELLKHLEGSNTVKDPTSRKPTTRLVNASKYLRQHQSAPSSRAASPLSGENGKLVKPTAKTQRGHGANLSKTSKLSLQTSTNHAPKPVQVSKVFPIGNSLQSQNKSNKLNDKGTNSRLQTIKEDSQNCSLFTSTPESVKKTFRPTTAKRRAAVIIDPLPNKRQRAHAEINAKKVVNKTAAVKVNECTERPSAEHDYCHRPAKVESLDSDVLCAAMDVTGLLEQDSSTPSGETVDPSNSKSSANNKVLKWEEYLQRVRLGTRSAPNSPTTSPKITRGSARKVNNFMVMTSTGSVVSVPKPVSQLVEPIVAAKRQTKQKSAPMKLQEFQEYLAKLQNQQQAVPVSSTTLVANQSPTPTLVKISQSTAPITASTVTVAVPTCKPGVLHSGPIATSQPFIKIQTGGKIHTAAVTSSQAIMHDSAPLIMIHIPAASTSTNVVNVPCVAAKQSQALPTVVTAVPAQVISANGQPVYPPDSEANTIKDLLKDPRILTKAKPKPLPTVLKPISRVKWCSKKAVNKSGSQGSVKTTSSATSIKTSSSTAAFKLITSSNNDGVHTNSVTLNGVTGQLKELLTLLLQQQKQQVSKNDQKEIVNQQQQQTLQRLFAAINEINSQKSNISTTTTNSITVSSTGLTTTMSAETKCNKKPTTKKTRTVPSPLSLIHEIKQNMNKKKDLTTNNDLSQELLSEYTASPSTRDKNPTRLLPTTNISPAESSSCVEVTSRNLLCDADNNQTLPSPASSVGDFTVLSEQVIPQCSTVKNNLASANYPLPSVLTKPSATSPTEQEQNQITVLVDRPVNESSKSSPSSASSDNSINKAQTNNVTSVNASTSSQIPVIINQKVTANSTEASADDFSCPVERDTDDKLRKKAVKCTTDVAVSSNSDQAVTEVQNAELVGNPAKPAESNSDGKDLTEPDQSSYSVVLSQKPDEIFKCRSMAASEMMTDDMLKDSQEKELVFDPSTFKDQTKSNAEETSAENAADQQYYNKLPAYLYSGKVIASDLNEIENLPLYEDNSDECLKRNGLKELSNDPLIGNEGSCSEKEDDIQYNKLPHYLSSGKLEPRPSTEAAHGSSGTFIKHTGTSTSRHKRGLSFSTKLKCTPQGNVIDTNETFYSRLPSYYSYGRTHVVDTVTEPPDQPDETVTEESLVRQEEERKSKREKKKRKKKKKKKHKKGDKRLDGDRILYSKLPFYLLSGRKPLAPERGASEQSYSSSQTLSSDSDHESAAYLRRNYKRTYSPDRSRSPSYSTSRSRSRSPVRSWKQEKRNYRSDSYSSRYDRDGYSSESDYEARRSKRRRRRSSSDDSSWGYKAKRRKDEKAKELENQAIQQRRVMYVGRITSSTTERDLINRFHDFGSIETVRLHFRKRKDSYAFVTFKYTCDAYSAIEHGNDGDVLPKYVLCFGGRRHFCEVEYKDLDNEVEPEKANDDEDDFDTLLKQAMRR